MTRHNGRSEQSEGRTSSFWVLLSCGVLSFIYFVGIGLVLLLGMKAGEGDSTCTAGFLFCLVPNEFGDLLAGIFAPLAFVWLMAAVLIQAMELKLTRQEMALQRVELGLSREVAVESKGVAEAQAKAADAQARAAESNALAAETQNKILDEQLQFERRERNDEQFSFLLDQFYSIAGHGLSGDVWVTNTVTGERTLFSLVRKFLPEQRNVALGAISDDMLENISAFKTELSEHYPAVSKGFYDEVCRASALLHSIKDFESDISTHNHYIANRIQVRKLIAALEQFRQALRTS
ncbi:hypothetical protein [Phyllobacterium sp. 22552]|uniref:hypothetical protein n=1 Tax=Phyllobacterium sp. 22552 TaxID=3453941 RepID=UPI003F84E364